MVGLICAEAAAPRCGQPALLKRADELCTELLWVQDLWFGKAIVMISSEYPELLAMCDRFVVIGNGRIVGELTKAEASESRLIKLASMVQ